MLLQNYEISVRQKDKISEFTNICTEFLAFLLTNIINDASTWQGTCWGCHSN